MTIRDKKVTVYIVALEPSGDFLGAKLISALKALEGENLELRGVGGSEMKRQGFKSLFDPEPIALLGIFEVLPKLLTIKNKLSEVIKDINLCAPDVLVTIDSWGFTGRIHRYLSACDSPIKRVRYVAPQVWAWRPGRAKQLANWIDCLLTLFEFEVSIFEQQGLKTVWVGHPLMDNLDKVDRGLTFRQRHLIPEAAKLLAVLPGSRSSELKKLLPIFGSTIKKLRKSQNDLYIVIATVDSTQDTVTKWAEEFSEKTIIVSNSVERNLAFNSCNAAIAASGTVSLELALCKVPHCVTYKVNIFTALIFKLIRKIRFINLINIISKKEVVPEFLQNRCNPTLLAKCAEDLLSNNESRRTQIIAFAKVLNSLKVKNKEPSQEAAKAILQTLRN